MASPSSAKEKAATWKANKEKIAYLVSQGLDLNQVEEELQRSGCRVTAQVRECIIWEMRAPEVRELLAQGFDVAAIEEIMRSKKWIWTDNIKKKALWEFHREEIIGHYKVLRSVEAVREIMAKKGFMPQTRIYYEWLNSWGISTSIDRHRQPGDGALPPYVSTNPATPLTETIPYDLLHEVYGLSQPPFGKMISGGDNHLSQDPPYQSIVITAPGEEGHIRAYEPAPISMDVDEGSKIDTLHERSSSDMRLGGVASSGYYRKPQASIPGDHQGDHSTRTIPAPDDSISGDNENSDEGEDVDDFHGTAIRDDAIPFLPRNATIFPPWPGGEMERSSKSKQRYIEDLQRIVIHRNESQMPGQIALNPMQHRGSSDSGIGLEYSSSSRPASSMRDSSNKEPNGEKQAFSKHLLHSISCSVNHQGTDFNFHCCGSSCLQELALSALNMPPQQVNDYLCQYMLCEGVRLYDYAGNTFLHKLAIAGVSWSYFEAGLNAHINPCHRNAYGQTFAHVLDFSAFQTNLMECLTSLRELGIDFGLRDASGRTVLHCLYGQPMTPTTARQILQFIDSPGRLLSLRDVSGRTPCEIFKHTFSQQVTANPRRSTTELQLQMVGIFEDIVDGGVLRLEDEGVDWSVITDNPEDLRTALQSQYNEVINNAKNGIVVEAVDGSNAFHAQAALMTIHDAPTDLRSLEKFISIGIDANDYDNYGRTPLEAVITQPRDYETELTTSEKVSLLIDKGKASVHSRNRLGHTPLYSAAIRGLDRTVEALLRRGSHTNIRDNDGQSLLQAVIEASHRAFVEYCESGYCRYHEAQCSRIEECKMLLERYGAVPDPTPAQSMGYAARHPILQ